MMAFYVVRGHSLNEMANLNYYEKAFLHGAREEYYKEETEKYKAILGEK